jgi:hypothetical protein
MAFDKMPTHTQWSNAKKGCGADKLVRDQWHIGEHLDKYHANKDKATAKFFALKDLKSKFDRYQDALKGKDKAKTCTTLINDIVALVAKIGGKIKKLEDKHPLLKAHSEAEAEKLRDVKLAINEIVI